MIVGLIVVLCLLATAACSEQSDEGFTAVYSGTINGGDMTVTGSTEGNLSFSISGDDTRGMHLDGEDYLILAEGDEEIVIDAKIVGELFVEVIPEEFKQMMELTKDDKIELRNDGKTTVNGREGIGYRNVDGPADGAFFVVISEDPELKPFAKAMSRQFTTSIALNPMANPGMFDNVVEVVQSGFPISLGGGKLTEFEQTVIAADTFKLPGSPLDKDATRKALIARGMLPEEKIEVPKEISDAIEKRIKDAEAE